MKLKPTAVWRRRTWPWLGLPGWTCCHDRTSGPPDFSKRIACAMTFSSVCGETRRLAYSRKTFEQTLRVGDRQRAYRPLADIGSRVPVDQAFPGGGMAGGERAARREAENDSVRE